MALVSEAMVVGLLSQDGPIRDADEVTARLVQALNSDFVEALPPVAADVEDAPLQERDSLREQYAQVRARLTNLDRFEAEVRDYNYEAGEQVSRLSTLSLLAPKDEPSACPICEQSLTELVPSVRDLQLALGSLADEIGSFRAGSQQVEELRQGYLEESDRLREQLAENSLALTESRSARENYRRFAEAAVAQANVKGRISLYLDSQRRESAEVAVGDYVTQLEAEIEALELELSGEEAAERLDSALSFVSNRIGELARILEIEHSESRIRLDIRRLTLVVDTA